jgi:hypothetical protein
MGISNSVGYTNNLTLLKTEQLFVATSLEGSLLGVPQGCSGAKCLGDQNKLIIMI